MAWRFTKTHWLISTQTIACPVVAKITLYTVISGSLTALAFVRSNEDCGGDLNDAFFRLPYLYAQAMANASIGGTPYDGTWFYTYKKFFEGYMAASSQLYTTIQGRYMLGRQIMCAAMIRVRRPAAKR